MSSPSVIACAAVTLAAAGAATAVHLAQPSAHAQVLERLPELIAFVEQERGLQMRRDVPVDVLPDAAFVRALHEGEVEPDEDAPDLGATYDALGFLDEGADLGEEVTASLDEDVAAFYDPHAERVVVRAGLARQELQGVLVHELTHALDDQWFHTGRDSLYDLTERGLAFSALLEGSAVRVELAWWDEQQPDEDTALEDTALQEDLAEQEDEPAEEELSTPADVDVVEADLDFPYTAGLALVDALLAEGGQERLDEAFRFPPLTSEQVLHPELMGSGWPVVPPLPEGEGTRVDEGVLGERGLALLLGVDPLEGDGAQVGWEGDAYATYESPDGERCTSADVVMADEAARDRLVAALRVRSVQADATGASALRLRVCG